MILVNANGRAFCTGADLGEVIAARASESTITSYLGGVQTLFERFEASPLPVVAAVHGLALAGGLEMVLACDVVFAAETSRFGDQHSTYGLVPAAGGTQRLPHIVGVRRALDLMYSARKISATEAERYGLVNYVVSEDALATESMQYCRELAKKSPPGLAAMKQLCRKSLEVRLSEGLESEKTDVIPAIMGPEVDEGLAAFQARREPSW